MRNLDPQTIITLAGVDWQQAWEASQTVRCASADAVHWDKRALSYGERSNGEYEEYFLNMAAIRPGSTVLDFGCGVGLLSIPLAQAGCHVIAADFSAGMLAKLRADAEAAGVGDLITTIQVAWDDDWEAAGLGEDSVDVAIASRSLATDHLLDALMKLDRCSRERVCITVAAGLSPRRDARAFDAVGIPRRWVSDYIFTMNILWQHGVFPTLDYTISHSRPAFEDRQEAIDDLGRMLRESLDDAQSRALAAFVDEHYSYNPDALPGRHFESDVMRTIRWAYISWGATES